jgi:hypothetical protein
MCKYLLFGALTAAMLAPMLRAQEIRIPVLNGRNGHPIINERLNVWLNQEQRDPKLVPTRKDGTLVLQLSSSHSESIHIAPGYYFYC